MGPKHWTKHQQIWQKQIHGKLEYAFSDIIDYFLFWLNTVNPLFTQSRLEFKMKNKFVHKKA